MSMIVGRLVAAGVVLVAVASIHPAQPATSQTAPAGDDEPRSIGARPPPPQRLQRSNCGAGRSAPLVETSARRELERDLDRLVAGRPLGLAVALKEIVYSHQARRARTPASNQKLLLSMALMDALGPRFRIPTSAAAPAVTRRGTVHGDLWLIGRGDPTVTSGGTAGPSMPGTSLDGLARRIAASGVERVTGRVLGDSSYFRHDFDAPGWQPYVPGNYVELPTALSLDGNLRSGEPETGAAAQLTTSLRQHGIRVEGDPGSGVAPRRLAVIGRVHSAPLGALLSRMASTSSNFFAETLGKLLGAKTYGRPGSISKGAKAIARWARLQHVKVDSRDASGLSYSNRISARDLVTLLTIAHAEPWGRAFRRGLPAAGHGTLAGRLPTSNVHAKTGTLFNGASALSGWVRSTGAGRWVAFSILSRGMSKATARTIEDDIVQTISKLRTKRTRPPARSPCRPER